MNEPAGLYKTIRIAGINEEIKDFKTFAFADDNNIAYKPGQYVTLVYHSHNVETRRSYSITSSPALNEPLSIGVKRIENGLLSRKLVDTAVIGDELITIGSGGLFILPDDIQNYKQIIFFAAGSGITPVYSLIKTALHVHPHLSLVLIYSNASPEKTIFLHQLKHLQKTFAFRFHIEFLFSNILELSRARLHRELLLEFLAGYSVPDSKEILFYICGPESYMRMCTYTLREHDVPKDNIKREDFAINAVRKRDASPPDKNTHNVFIQFNGQEIDVAVNYPDAILQSAKKQGIVLPYSCEAGRCGSCVAKCVKGKVWHSYNEVLTEKELQQGLVLTCVGHPVGGDVELRIDV